MRVDDKISILLPFKDEELFIEACLKSILNQSYKNWELVAVDDHSIDSSPDIVRKYAAENNRIRLIQNLGRGVIQALDTAFKESTGQWISRMDGDDIKTPDNLESLFSISAKGQVAIGLVKYFREDGLGDGYESYGEWLNAINKEGKTWENVYRECVIPSPCWLAHAEDLEKCGGFNSNLYPEDYDLCFRFYGSGLKVRCTSNIIHLWRDHETRTTRVSEYYADNRFLNLKIHHFLNIDFNTNRTLCLVGAGNKGKQVAKVLIEKSIPFNWFSNNMKKVGRDIYGVVVQHNQEIKEIENADALISVSAKQQTTLKALKDFSGRSFYLF